MNTPPPTAWENLKFDAPPPFWDFLAQAQARARTISHPKHRDPSALHIF